MKHFRVQCTIRILLLAATLVAAVYLLVATAAYAAAAGIAIIALFEVRSLIRYVDKTNRDLARFLRSIRYSDFSQTFTAEGRGGSYAELGAAFREVMADFRKARAEKEEHYRYLHTVMQHIGVGLISFRQDGSVELINNAAKRLLRVRRLRNIRALSDLSREFVETLTRMHSGDKELIKIVDNDEMLQLSLSATEFKMRGDLFKLVSLQNIQSELEEKEIEAWQKLTRVLTHEIMNSITPISSLASTANELLEEYDAAVNGRPQDEAIGDVRDAVYTIAKRSNSLLHFVNAYRSLTRIPQPDFQIVSIRELFDNVKSLMQAEMEKRGVSLMCEIDPSSLTVTADPELVERVLINLIKNATESVEGSSGAHVFLRAALNGRGRTIIQVIDTGSGIIPEAIDKIFIPFFTTKKEGSGIGLSLSREIMRQHGGTIGVVSKPNERTVFSLRF
jgi:nitrogen fixation/metabolism regulation signal transduction histidine kinase